MLKGDKDLVQGVERWGERRVHSANRSDKISWLNVSVREKESNNSAFKPLRIEMVLKGPEDTFLTFTKLN